MSDVPEKLRYQREHFACINPNCTAEHDGEYISLAAHDKAVAELKAEVEQWKANAHHHGADAHRLASELVDAQRLIATLTAKAAPAAQECQRCTHDHSEHVLRYCVIPSCGCRDFQP